MPRLVPLDERPPKPELLAAHQSDMTIEEVMAMPDIEEVVVYDTYDWQHRREKYKPEVMAKIILQSGGYPVRAGRMAGVTTQTVLQYCERYVICMEALREARSQRVERFESALETNAIKNHNVAAQIFGLKNLAPDRWKDTRRNENLNVNVEPQKIKIGEKEIEF